MWSLHLYKQGEVPKLWMTEGHSLSDGEVSWIQDPAALPTLLLVCFPLFASSNCPSCLLVSEAFLFLNCILFLVQAPKYHNQKMFSFLVFLSFKI